MVFSSVQCSLPERELKTVSGEVDNYFQKTPLTILLFLDILVLNLFLENENYKLKDAFILRIISMKQRIKTSITEKDFNILSQFISGSHCCTIKS